MSCLSLQFVCYFLLSYDGQRKRIFMKLNKVTIKRVYAGNKYFLLDLKLYLAGDLINKSKTTARLTQSHICKKKKIRLTRPAFFTFSCYEIIKIKITILYNGGWRKTYFVVGSGGNGEQNKLNYVTIKEVYAGNKHFLLDLKLYLTGDLISQTWKVKRSKWVKDYCKADSTSYIKKNIFRLTRPAFFTFRCY